GMRVVASWPDQLKAAQEVATYQIGGKTYARLAYGDEGEDWGADSRPCHDCAAIKGQFHVPGCDVERCPKCKGQSISCDCAEDEFSNGEFDFKIHKEKAVSAYLLKRPHYEEACLVAKNILKRSIERAGIKISSIDARSKDPDSFGLKVTKP